MKWFVILVVIMGLATIGVANAVSSQPEDTQAQGKGKDMVEHFTFNGQERTYLLHLPPGLDKEKPVPLLVMLHYYTGTGEAEAYQTGFSDKADVEHFIAVYPDGPNPAPPGFAWNTPSPEPGPNADAAFVGELIKRSQAQYTIDQKRIYVCGMSQGAFAAYAIGCELSSVVAAIAPVNGILFTKPKSADPISVLIINGTDDQGIPFNGAAASEETGDLAIPSVAEAVAVWVAHNGCSKEPKKTMRENIAIEVYSGGRQSTEVVLYKRIGGGHEWPGDHSDKTKTTHIDAGDIWEFFKQHPKQ